MRRPSFLIRKAARQLGWRIMGVSFGRRRCWRLGSLLYHWGSERFDLWKSDYPRRPTHSG